MDTVNIHHLIVNTAEKQVTVSAVSRISDYLSNELGVLSALCAAAAPVVALGILESTETEQQLQCFQYCYEKGYSLQQDTSFLSWSKLKSGSDKQRTELKNDGSHVIQKST